MPEHRFSTLSAFIPTFTSPPGLPLSRWFGAMAPGLAFGGLALLAWGLMAPTTSWAQAAPVAPASSSTNTPTPNKPSPITPSPSATATETPISDLGQVEIRSQRNNDSEVRQSSTASKIVIGREEISKQGDATLGDVLKRLPGVTVQGAPGRGGSIRMRGLGSGYTQLLLDGERMPPGFSVDSLTPDQVERIEIMRAPTAETGARAIAGTINIVLREGQKADPDDLKISQAQERGEGSSTLNWVHNLNPQALAGTLTLSAMDSRRADDSLTETQSDFQPSEVREARFVGHRQGIHANARVQWKGEQGKSLSLTPFLVYSEYTAQGRIEARPLSASAITDTALTDNRSRYVMGRLNGQWRQRLSADDRLELNFGLGRSVYDQHATQTVLNPTTLLADAADAQRFNDRNTRLSGKWTRVLANGHEWVSGLEHEGVHRVEEGSAAANPDSGDLKARTQRWAAYTQDEFKINAHWSAYAGMRYESILTEGEADGSLRTNKSHVWTPLLHALWKPNPAQRDQVRMSLTRSYKTPSLYNMVAPLRYARDYPVAAGGNQPTQPDRMGNADLRPELATGIDVGFERHLEGGGVLSASVFRRNIQDVIRYQTALQAVPGASVSRWLSMPRNVGDAIIQGIELEAKFRLNQVWANAWAVDIRSNAGFFKSKVLDLPGPDNRLDRQPSMTANLGADYRLRSVPLSLGGNINWNPDYDTRISQEQMTYQGVKRVADVYGLWRLSAATGLRLTVSNLLPRDYVTASTFTGDSQSETARTTDRSWRNVQLRLEMKI